MSFLEDTSLRYPSGVYTVENKFNRTAGQLYLGQNEYVYSTVSNSVVWLKFLGIGIALPFIYVAKKICAFINKCQGYYVPEKGFHDFKHVWNLSSMAWKAVTRCSGTDSILEDVEKFSLAEIDYNNKNRNDEMQRPRSVRLQNGVYLAKCMHPLFHRHEYREPTKARERLEVIKAEEVSLRESLNRRTEQPTGWTMSMFNSVKQWAQPDPYKELRQDEIEHLLFKKLQDHQRLSALIDRGERCQKYINSVIASQQTCCDPAPQPTTNTVIIQSDQLDTCCDPATNAVTIQSNQFVLASSEECSCFDVSVYRHEQVCGCIHKVDCCATRCFAIDCLPFCFCCFWPDTQQCCILA